MATFPYWHIFLICLHVNKFIFYSFRSDILYLYILRNAIFDVCMPSKNRILLMSPYKVKRLIEYQYLIVFFRSTKHRLFSELKKISMSVLLNNLLSWTHEASW